MQTHQLKPEHVVQITARVHQAAIDVLGPVVDPKTVHQAKFSMPTVLALIALFGRAGLREFDRHYADPGVIAFREKITMELDPEIDAAYPRRWIGKVLVRTKNGQQYSGRVDEPKGDPGNTLSRGELEDKVLRLAHYGQGATELEMSELISWAWRLPEIPAVGTLLPGPPQTGQLAADEPVPTASVSIAPV